MSIAAEKLFGDKALDPQTKKLDVSRLSGEEKEKLSALGKAAGALVGGVVGGNVGNAQVGAVVGANAVENNHLNTIDEVYNYPSAKYKFIQECNNGNSSKKCQDLANQIKVYLEKGKSIEKFSYPDGADDMQEQTLSPNQPGKATGCIISPNGVCIITNKSTPDGKEWLLRPATEQQAQQYAKLNKESLKKLQQLASELYLAGCATPTIEAIFCNVYHPLVFVIPLQDKNLREEIEFCMLLVQ